MTAIVFPSGEQFPIALGEQHAVVVEVGGGLRAYSVGERDVLDGYTADETSPSGRGQVLIPWPNRLEDGQYEWEGQRHHLVLDEPESANAIHGLVRWARWSVAEHEPHRVVMEHVLHPQPGYPFSLALAIEYRLSDQGLEVRTTATNVGSQACPYGAGAHPYLTAGTPTVDTTVLHAPARTVLRANDRGIPVGEDAAAGSGYDFLRPRAIGATRLDHCFTGLERDEDGLARVVLRSSDDQNGVTVWMDQAYRYVMLFTGDPLPDVARRSLAVEPMTCPPNAFRTGTDLISLAPGESASCAWGIHPST